MSSVATDVRSVVASVVDPEIPVLTIEELGILRDVATDPEGTVIVTITPTYSGCPALRQIEDDIGSALRAEGVSEYEVRTVHNPPWSTDWIGEDAREKLAAFGIAPPTTPTEILCPRCQSTLPRIVARFGSTACKALMVCASCGEPFDYFKRF